MNSRRASLRLPQLALALLLLAGQLAAIVHAFEHDPGAAPSQACASCITAAQLGSAAVADQAAADLPPASFSLAVDAPAAFLSANKPAIRQRGPPAFLPTL